MRILITGAAGFVGGALLGRLLRDSDEAEVTALDLTAQPSWASGPRLRWIRGGLDDRAVLDQLGRTSFDLVFHLASIPGGRAEVEPALGRCVNLDASLDLLQSLAKVRNRPRVVYASSIAVYGALSGEPVTSHTEARPAITYGAHKRMVEIALADHTRRGDMSGISLRLPGIVARPRPVSGFGSAFMSELLHAVSAAEKYVCPVSPAATAWWLSAKTAVDNLITAGTIDTCGTLQLPALRLSIAEVVNGLAELYGPERTARVTFDPDPRIEAVFGRYPALDTRAESALGFVHDGSVAEMIPNAL
ncbi:MULTISPECIES: NAD-dependent epimerase/dehydratase family protein [unclassified Bradyrhizobium]|uniref:NAD-dependent epimerase/dehydratase family protein n=1 Tax=unclassified Bradyrhizobium TaxID=2631580 RepID=UPI002915F65C|nr:MULTISPECIES: NAD-dependent epimerase/dehydratase family protein [unclassified Bradyrhizobium]